MDNRANDTESGNSSHVTVRVTHGDGLLRRELTPEIVARFTPKYKKTQSGCWLWQAGKYPTGYGQFALDRSSGRLRVMQAHRIAYVLAHGDIPAWSVIMHSCDVRACVNPNHLSLGTPADNVADCVAKGRLRGWKRLDIRKISDAQLADIRSSSEKSVTLAKQYNVSLCCISMLRRGLRRKQAA